MTEIHYDCRMCTYKVIGTQGVYCKAIVIDKKHEPHCNNSYKKNDKWVDVFCCDSFTTKPVQQELYFV